MNKKIEQLICRMQHGEDLAEFRRGFSFGREFVKTEPTADVAPVVHGRWEFGNTQGHDWMKCSECSKSQSGWTGVFSYCPNCGAKMDGGK